MSREGMSSQEIAQVIGRSDRVVRMYLSGERQPHRTAHKATADRFEYFNADEARFTGNYHNGNKIYDSDDPVFEEIALLEELEMTHG